MKLGTLFVNAQCQLQVKYYTIKVVMIEYYISVTSRNYSFPDMCLYELFFQAFEMHPVFTLLY